MKKLLYIILLLPLWVNAQTSGTIQKTSATGTIQGSFGSLGLDTLTRVTGALVNGYILKYHAATNKWYASPDVAAALGTSSISLGGTANGLSYSAGNYRLHKVTATTGGVLTTGADTIRGDKTFKHSSNSSVKIMTSGEVSKIVMNGRSGAPEARTDYSLEGANQFSLGQTSSGGFNLYNEGTAQSIFSASTANNGFTVTSLTNGLVKSTSGLLSNATAGTDYLTPTGSGSGLSGVVLTTTNQSIAGNKTFTDALTIQHNLGLNPASNPAIFFQAASSTKWIMQASGDASANWQLARYNDAGVFQDYSISVNRSTGATTLSGALTGTSATFSASLPLTITSSSGQAIKSIAADATGDNYFSFYRSNGSTLKGLIGFSTSSTDIFRIINAENDAMEFGTNNITRYTIDASGNNTWTGAGLFGGSLEVTGTLPSNRTSTAVMDFSSGTTRIFGFGSSGVSGGIRFFTGVGGTSSQEVGTFTSGGFFKASNDGTYFTASGLYHEFRGDAADWITRTSNKNANPQGLTIEYTSATPNSTSNIFLYAADASAVRFSLYSNGGIANYSANNVNLSDERVKKNIVKAGSYWDIIKAIEFDSYKYKDQKDKRKLLGVMAQQVENIYPEWVSNSGSFGKASDGSNYKSVYEQQLQYGVNIVVQESMKRIEALEAEIAILKSK